MHGYFILLVEKEGTKCTCIGLLATLYPVALVSHEEHQLLYLVIFSIAIKKYQQFHSLYINTLRITEAIDRTYKCKFVCRCV